MTSPIKNNNNFLNYPALQHTDSTAESLIVDKFIRTPVNTAAVVNDLGEKNIFSVSFDSEESDYSEYSSSTEDDEGYDIGEEQKLLDYYSPAQLHEVLENHIEFDSVAAFIESETTLLAQPDTSFVFRKNHKNVLPNTLQKLEDGTVFIHPKGREFKVGEGAVKKVYFIVNALTREILANKVSKHDTAEAITDNLRELEIQRLFAGAPYIEPILTTTVYRNINGIQKISIHSRLYDGSMNSLKKTLEESLNKPEMQRQFIQSLLIGLQAIHQRGYLHRDIKSDNILLQEDGETFIPMITDFGLALQEKEATHENVAGSNWYLAPEIANHRNDPSFIIHKQSYASDIYAMGIVIGEAIGYLEPSELALHYMRETEEPPAPAEATLEHLVWSMTRHDPALRISLTQALELI